MVLDLILDGYATAFMLKAFPKLSENRFLFGVGM
jgi:hypothetical protein